MQYIKVLWHHSHPDEPIFLYSELDENRWEIRKVYIFRDGTAGYACDTDPTTSVELGLEPLPPFSQISSDPQFELEVIDKKSFEVVWDKVRRSA